MVNVPPCPRHARIAIQRIHELAERRAVRITLKALNEAAALEPPADIDDVLEVLSDLTAADWRCRIHSVTTGEPMQIFKPLTDAFGLLYVKVIVRRDCVVVSFHEEVEP
jgi:hypothetical protein